MPSQPMKCTEVRRENGVERTAVDEHEHVDVGPLSSSPVKPSFLRPRVRSPQDYIPLRLRSQVVHLDDDFYGTLSFEPRLMAQLMAEGFLPIATMERRRCILLPKLHRERSLVRLSDETLHVPKTVKKRSKKFTLRINHDFDGIVAGCHQQHGVAWLYPPIVHAFRLLFNAGARGVEVEGGATVRFYSIEVLDAATHELVAGELGYTVGRVYTSLTGFSGASGAGTVQLHALRCLLRLSGIHVWDLGMSMPYKASLGAVDEPRDDFLALLYKWRGSDCRLQLKEGQTQGELSGKTGVHVKEVVELMTETQRASEAKQEKM